jgi:hypothetical protein
MSLKHCVDGRETAHDTRRLACAVSVSILTQGDFAATLTDDLMPATDVGRQRMYDTFGDKNIPSLLKALKEETNLAWEGASRKSKRHSATNSGFLHPTVQ